MRYSDAGESSRPAARHFLWLILAIGVLALYPVQLGIDLALSSVSETSDLLYLPSGAILRRASLGHEGLLADIYWTRVVQYFGRKRMSRATRFELLGPLLGITTDLDPHLLVAYRFGSIFLAEKPPGGAGRPDEALQLLRRGIVANPDYWRLWQDLGFIYYWDLKDYPSAARIFKAGAERPGALIWMRVMAAAVAAKGGDVQTSRTLWSEIYEHSEDESVRQSALEHLAALEAQTQIEQLNGLLERFRAREGRAAHSWFELIQASYLARLPRDPSNALYALGADGWAKLGPESKIDLRLLQ